MEQRCCAIPFSFDVSRFNKIIGARKSRLSSIKFFVTRSRSGELKSYKNLPSNTIKAGEPINSS